MPSLEWTNWCRLCGVDGGTTNEIKLNLLKIMETFFKVELSILDYKICENCLDFMDSIFKYSKKVERIQKMFSELETNANYNVKINLEEVQEKYNIFENKVESRMKPIFDSQHNNTHKNYKRIDGKINLENSIAHQIIKTEVQCTENNKKNRITRKKSKLLGTSKNIISENNNNNLENGNKIRNKNSLNNVKNSKHKTIRKKDMLPKICEFCNEIFQSVESYVLHKKVEHKVNNRTCLICLKLCDSKKKLIIHANKHLPSDKKIYYNCEYCDKRYTSPWQIKEHTEAIHFNTCRTCKEKFSSYEELKAHMELNHSRNAACKLCGKVLKSISHLKAHEQTHIPLKDRELYGCNLCGKKFTTPSTLRYHIRDIHQDEKEFICENCGKGYSNKTNFDLHIATHKEDSYKCEVCQKGFKYKHALKRHRNVHSEEKYPCKICNAVLKNSLTLQRHMVVHSSEKKFECNFCGKLFYRSKNLKSHMMIIHTSLKPYQCTFCSESYSSKSNCTKHERTSHPIEFAELQAKGLPQQVISIPTLKQLEAMIQKNENLKVSHITTKT